MKRNFLFPLAFIFSFTLLSTSYAQINLDAGLRVGINRAQMDVAQISEGTTIEQLQGYMGGVFLRLTLLNLIAVQPEINYTQKGSILSVGENIQSTFTLNYVEVPVVAKLNIIKLLGFLQTSVYGGVAFSKLLEAKSRTEIGENSSEEDVKELFNERDNSYVGGVDVQLNLGMLKLLVDGRVTLSRSNIFVPEMDNEARNRVYSLSVGFLF